MKSKLIKVHPDLWQGDSINFEGEDVIILSDVKAKHKITMVDLEPESKIYMYGVLYVRCFSRKSY